MAGFSAEGLAMGRPAALLLVDRRLHATGWPMPTITLELAIARATGGHAATLTADLPAGAARLASGVALNFTTAALRALETTPDVYFCCGSASAPLLAAGVKRTYGRRNATNRPSYGILETTERMSEIAWPPTKKRIVTG